MNIYIYIYEFTYDKTCTHLRVAALKTIVGELDVVKEFQAKLFSGRLGDMNPVG